MMTSITGQIDLSNWFMISSLISKTSVTRSGDLLDFGQLFKAFGNNWFAQISHVHRQFFVNVLKSIIFQVKSF